MWYTFNWVTKVISLTSITTLDIRDMRSRWIEWVDLPNNSKYALAFRTVWWDDIDVSAWISIPIYVFIQNWWKIKPMESNHTLKITNWILVDSAWWDPFVNTTWSFIVRINYQQPVQAITVNTWWGGGWWLTAQEVRDALALAPTTSPVAGSIDGKLWIINDWVKKWSILVPHTTNL